MIIVEKILEIIKEDMNKCVDNDRKFVETLTINNMNNEIQLSYIDDYCQNELFEKIKKQHSIEVYCFRYKNQFFFSNDDTLFLNKFYEIVPESEQEKYYSDEEQQEDIA